MEVVTAVKEEAEGDQPALPKQQQKQRPKSADSDEEDLRPHITGYFDSSCSLCAQSHCST